MAAAADGTPQAAAPAFRAAEQTDLPVRTVRVAIFPDAPFAVHEASGRWDGFAAVVLQAAAAQAHLNLEFHECASLNELFEEVAGGTADKPVGLVYIAVSNGSGTQVQEYRFGDPGRSEVRLKTVEAALRLLATLL